jgi:hypothetical protein
MRSREARAAPRKTTLPNNIYDSKTFLPPVGGWASSQTLVKDSESTAQVLENFFPSQFMIRPRGGSSRRATVSTRAVRSIITYRSGTTQKIFCAADGKIFDATAPASPFSYLVAVLSGRTSDLYSFVNFATVGGTFVIAVNGADLHLVYDGLNWATNVPAITGVSSALFNHVWSYKNRLFFVEKDSMRFWFLPVDTIGGAASSFSLAGVFQRGGSILAGATWSQDSGDGLDDKCAIFSTAGEVAIYEGANPASPTDWALVGRYDISEPLGRNGFMRVGGDLLILTVNGVIPLSAAVVKDQAALSLAAVSRAIEPDWKEAVRLYRNNNWSMIKWPEQNMAIIAFAQIFNTEILDGVWGQGEWGGEFVWGTVTVDTANPVPTCFVVNLETGAWAKYLGWDVQSIGYHAGEIYFGNSAGRLMAAEHGGTDDGAAYYCRAAWWPSDFGASAVTKVYHMARGVYRAATPFEAKVSISTDYDLQWDAAPSSGPNVSAGSLWDQALWDQALWDAGGQKQVSNKWTSLGRTGFSGTLQLQMTMANTFTPSTEILKYDVTFEGLEAMA